MDHDLHKFTMAKKKRKARSVSPASSGLSRNRRARHSENPVSMWDGHRCDKAQSVGFPPSTPSRPLFRGDADPYFPPNADAAVTTFSGEMDFRLKFLCQADPTEAGDLYKEAVQGLVNITVPPNILNQLCQDTIITQMQGLGAPQDKIDRVCELIQREMVFKISWLLANEMNTIEKVERGLATVIAATSRLHANKFDHEVFDDIAKGFENLRNQLSGLQTDSLASGASIRMPTAEQCSRRQSTAMSAPLANTGLESEGKTIPSNEANGTNEGQRHLYENDQSWNGNYKSKVDARRTVSAGCHFPRVSGDGSHCPDSDSIYGSVNGEAMIHVLEHTVRVFKASSPTTIFDEESGPESNDAKKANIQIKKTLLWSLTESPTPCVDLLYGTDPLPLIDTEAAVRKIVDEIDIRFENKLPSLNRRNKRGKLCPFTLKQILHTLRNQLNTLPNSERARSSMEKILQPLICMNPHCFKELGSCPFLFPKMMQDITPVLDLLHPNCPECCPDNEISIVDHIILAIQSREIKMEPDNVIIDNSNYNRMTDGMKRTLSGAFKITCEADGTRWLLETKLRMLVFKNRSRFPELEESTLGREWMVVSGCKW